MNFPDSPGARRNTCWLFGIGAGLIAILFTCLGCDTPSPYVPVRGTVTLDGKPLESGIVQFQPAAGQVATGEIGPAGAFSLATQAKNAGALAGTYKVTVVAYDPLASEQTPDSLIVPLRYTRSGTSGLQVTIFPGSTAPVKIELVSDEEATSSAAEATATNEQGGNDPTVPPGDPVTPADNPPAGEATRERSPSSTAAE